MSPADPILTFVAWCLGAMGLFMVTYNYRVIIFRKKESLAPLFGGIFLSLALWVHPVQIPAWVMFLPLIFDPGFSLTFYYLGKMWFDERRSPEESAPDSET